MHSSRSVHMHEKAVDCQRQRVSPPPCAASDAFNRSYRLPAHWPFAAIDLVMELEPGSCDLYAHRWRCCKFTSRDNGEPERHIREAIASFLSHDCPFRPAKRPCIAVDLGANNGWFTAMMLQTRARVTAVEPQPDLARAAAETVKLHCMSATGTVINARACAPSERGFASCMAPVNASGCNIGGWRSGGGVSQLSRRHGHRCAARTGLPSTVGGVNLTSVLLTAAAASPTRTPPTIDLIKVRASP